MPFRKYMPPSLKKTQLDLLEVLKYRLEDDEISYKLYSNPDHPVNASFTPEERKKQIQDEEIRQRIAFYKSVIKFAEEFDYEKYLVQRIKHQEEN